MIKTGKTFVSSFLLLGFIAGLIGFVVLLLFGWQNSLPSLIAGWLISLALILCGYLANNWGFSQSHKMFLAVLFGGMTLRIVTVVGIVYWVNRAQWLPMLTFLVNLTIYYFIFQSIELVVIKRQLTKPK